jgi:hypothetical protein
MWSVPDGCLSLKNNYGFSSIGQLLKDRVQTFHKLSIIQTKMVWRDSNLFAWSPQDVATFLDEIGLSGLRSAVLVKSSASTILPGFVYLPSFQKL